MKRLFMLFLILVSVLSAHGAIASNNDAEEGMALLINLNGLLCAKVVSVTPLKIEKTYEVRCIEYRGGTRTVDYIVNLKTGRAFQRNNLSSDEDTQQQAAPKNNDRGIAGVIGDAGYQCHEALSVKNITGSTYGVECVERAWSENRAKYSVNVRSGMVIRK